MAGDWIKMRIDLQTHPKVVRILSATASDKFRVIGGLHAVWAVFDTHSVDGTLPGYTPFLMDHVIGWDGFSAAMISVGWMVDIDGSSLALPEFDEHNGASGKRRAEDQKRKKNARKSEHCPDDVRNLSASEPDEMLTREEKRREEDTSSLRSEVKTPRPARKASPAVGVLTVLDLVDQGVNEQHARDWLKVRGTRKAPLTQTAWSLLVSECNKAGITPAQGVQVCARASWQSLDHTWNWRKFLDMAAAPGPVVPLSKFDGVAVEEPA